MTKLKDSIPSLRAQWDEQYENITGADSFLGQLKLKKGKLLLNTQDYMSEVRKNEALAKKKTKELAKAKEHAAFLQSSVDSLSIPELHTKYKDDLLDEQDKVRKLEEWMERHNPNKNNEAYMQYHMNLAYIEYIDAVALSFCEWFTTGAAGPGSLTYEGKTYTA